MCVILKNLIKQTKLAGLMRDLRQYFYFCLDLFGGIIFLPWRMLRRNMADAAIKKILIIRLDRIGDVILSTPAIRAVKRKYPEAEVHLLINAYTKDLVMANPNINRVLVYKQDRLDKDYDLAIALHPGLRQNYLTWASGAQVRIGYTGQGGSFFLTRKVSDDRQIRMRHEVDSALELVGLAGAATDDKSLEVSVNAEGESFAADFWQKNQLKPQDLVAVIHPGSRQKHIRWKREGFARLADRLIREKHLPVILIGSRDERRLVEEIAGLMQEKPLSAIDLKLNQLVSLIKKSALFIGNSTGPMHIAAALKVPVVAIFGNIHPLDSYQEWGPWGEGHIVVSRNLNCARCHPGDCLTFRCMELITPEEVFTAAQRQLNRIRQT